jgi:hypothetical protein
MKIDNFCVSPRYRQTVDITLGTYETYYCIFNICDWNAQRDRYLASGIGMVLMIDSDDIDWPPQATRNQYKLIYTRVNGVENPGSVSVRELDPFQLSITIYPNPFYPSTTIKFTLPSSGKANLVVYDIMGRKVRELVSGQLLTGNCSFLWDGRDDSGIAVSSGVYFAWLTMGKSVAVRKMLLMK